MTSRIFWLPVLIFFAALLLLLAAKGHTMPTCPHPNVARVVVYNTSEKSPLHCPSEGLCWRTGSLWGERTARITIECLTPAEHEAALRRSEP